MHCAPLNCQMLDGAVAMEPPSQAGDGGHCSPAVTGARAWCPCYPHCPHYLRCWCLYRDQGPGCGAGHGLSETRYRPRCGEEVVVAVVVVWWYADQNRHLSLVPVYLPVPVCPVAGSRSPFHPTLTPAGGLGWPGHNTPAPVLPICPA